MKFLLGLFVLTPVKFLLFWPVALLLAALVHPAFALGAVAPYVVTLFARRDCEPTSGLAGPAVRRGDLPRWLRWFETPDERLPGGFYEPRVLRVWFWANRHFPEWAAFRVTSGYWLGRNILHGAAHDLAVNVTGPVRTLGTQGVLGWSNPGVSLYLADGGWELQVQFPWPGTRIDTYGRRIGLKFRLGWKVEFRRWVDHGPSMFVFSLRLATPLDKGSK